MKSQRRLRLRQASRHRRPLHDRPWPDWVYQFELQDNMIDAFQRNVWPRHYADELPPAAYQQMDNYLTGQWSWHGPIVLHPGPDRYFRDALVRS